MFAHNRFDFGAAERFCSVPRNKHHIPSSAAQRSRFTVCFPDNSAAAVAFHRAAELFAGGHTDTANARAVFQYISDQRGICQRPAAPVDPAKIAVLLKGGYLCQSNQSVRSRVLKPARERISK